MVNPETRNIISSLTATPSPLSYRPPSDNINFNKVNNLAEKREIRFFSPKMMPEIRARIPCQYTSLDGMNMRNVLDPKDFSSSLSGHIGRVSSASYH